MAIRAAYAIAFDLDTKAMKADGLTDSQRTRIYQTEVPEALEKCGFDQHPQGSLYHMKDGADPMAALLNLKSNLQKYAPNFGKYVKRAHILRMEDWSDVTAELSTKQTSAAPPPTGEEELESQEAIQEILVTPILTKV